MVFGIVLDEWIGVNLPKTVFIENARLGFVDIFLKLCVLAYVIYTYYTNDSVSSVSFTPHSAISVWSESGNFTKGSQADMESDMCDRAKNDHYDYWYDDKGGWAYTNQTCVELGPRERAIKHPKSIYVPTYLDESFVWTKVGDNAVGKKCTDAQCVVLGGCPEDNTKNYTSGTVNDKGQCLCKCSTNRHQFATGVNQIEIVFQHLPQWEQAIVAALAKNDVHQPENLHEINMVTVIRDNDGKCFREFNSSEDIRLNVADILSLAGDRHGSYHLDDYHRDYTFENFLRGKSTNETYEDQLKRYPHLRVTGMAVNMRVSYFNHFIPPTKPREKSMCASSEPADGKTFEHPTCFIDVQIIPQWKSYPVADYFQANGAGEETSRSRYYYGILVTFSTSGSYQFFNWVKMLTYLASAIVYMSIPNALMVLFTKFCLGTLSEIYYAAQCQLLDTWELFSGQVCRALVGMNAFRKICDEGTPDGDAGAMLQLLSSAQSKPSQSAPSAQPEEIVEVSASRQVSENSVNSSKRVLKFGPLQAQLQELFDGHECLDRDEIALLERVLLRILEQEGKYGSTGDDPEHETNAQQISQRAFVEAAVNADIGTLKGWARLFDLDRKPCLLERFFDTNANARRRASADNTAPKKGLVAKAAAAAKAAVRGARSGSHLSVTDIDNKESQSIGASSGDLAIERGKTETTEETTV